MPGVIVKSSYMTNRTHIVHYMRYIATREGVEHLTASVRQRPATAYQQKYIADRLEKISKLPEYQEYARKGTIESASRLITADAEHEVSEVKECSRVARAARELPTGDLNHPATDKQRQFIEKHIEDAEGLPEYEDFLKNQTVGNASQLIEVIAEQHPTDPEIYLRYMAERPGVEKSGAPDGLFDLRGKADLTAECARILNSTGVVWAHIISLHREDAVRLGVDNADTWRKHLAAEAPKIAKLYNIDPSHMRVLAAFHNEGHHPHIHVLVYSEKSEEGTIPKSKMKETGKKMRSLFTNAVFREDLSAIKAEKTQVRDEMSQQIQNYKSLLYGKKSCIDPNILKVAVDLANRLPTSGKKQYAYFPADIKQQVNDMLRLIVEKDPAISSLAKTYFDSERKMLKMYHDDQKIVDEKLSETSAHFFEPRTGKYTKATDMTTLHNGIIRWLYAVREEAQKQEDSMVGRVQADSQGAFSSEQTNEKPEVLPVNNAIDWTVRPSDIDPIFSLEINNFLKNQDGVEWVPKNPDVLRIQKIENSNTAEQAFSIIQKMADHQNPEAQYRVAQMFEGGIGTKQSDFLTDKYYYKAFQNFNDKAVAQNNPFAYYQLGIMAAKGEGCLQNSQEALGNFKAAADLGHTHALYLLGSQLCNTFDVKANDIGVDYLEKAADAGHAGAICTLGKMYFDVEDAAMKQAGMNLLHIAADMGNTDALQIIQNLEPEKQLYEGANEKKEPEALLVPSSDIEQNYIGQAEIPRSASNGEYPTEAVKESPNKESTVQLGRLVNDIKKPEVLPVASNTTEGDRHKREPAEDQKRIIHPTGPAEAAGISQPEVLPVSSNTTEGDRHKREPAEDQKQIIHPTAPAEAAGISQPEVLPVNSEPELTASGDDIFTDDNIPFVTNRQATSDASREKSQYSGNHIAGPTVQYLVLLMLRELAGDIEQRCNTNQAYSRNHNRRRLRGRHPNHQSRHEEQEKPYEM